MHLFYGVYDSLLRLIEKEIIDTKILASIHLSMFLRLMGHIGKKKESSYINRPQIRKNFH